MMSDTSLQTEPAETSIAPLALPVGDQPLPDRALVLGALLAGLGGLAGVAALMAGYIGIRSQAQEWQPPDFEVDNFLGVMLTLTALLSAAFAAWAPVADRRGLRRQATMALVLATFVGLCLLNGIWYFGTRLGLAVSSSPFATFNYALIAASVVLVAGGLVGLLAALAKVAGRQSGPSDSGAVRAASWFWHCAVLAWVVVWATLFVLK